MSTAKREPVPAEFNGLARQFWRDLMANHQIIDKFWRDIETTIKKRQLTKRTVRPEYIIGIQREWQTFDAWSVHAFESSIKGGFPKLALLRLTPGQWNEGWDEFQNAFIVRANRIVMNRKRIEVDNIPVIRIAMHALARRYQRCKIHDRTVIIDETKAMLAWVGQQPPVKIDTVKEVIIPTDSGRWVGRVAWLADEQDETKFYPIYSVRTFIN